jgi:hypothetical protein
MRKLYFVGFLLPPGEKLENEVVGFDKPAEAKTLQSANKVN